MTPEEAVERVRAISDRCKQDRRGALSWISEVPIPVSLVWLPSAVSEDTELAAAFLTPRIRRRIQSLPEAWARREAYALCDRFALPVACGEALRKAPPPSPSFARRGRTDIAINPVLQNEAAVPIRSLHLNHTPLGQPVARWRGEVAVWARERGVRKGDLHISYTHDHDWHLTLAACKPELKGVGIDIVHLDRLRGERKGRRYLESFAHHFMSEEELTGCIEEGRDEDDERFRLRVAAHFSLMEAASKALGTGLAIGLGMGKPTSLPKKSIGVRSVSSTIEFMLDHEALARIWRLRASRLTGYWGADGEYLVSAAFLV